ncbi:hypothetical protein [Miltoncostaea oceani]|uniref:hypothetical protein n=1 Tax=Miltoncostaea oceani TaxID=2843216 RepID=UPI001C3E7A6E|nr:hypothetical protein [Miltoncostaea oceani]
MRTRAALLAALTCLALPAVAAADQIVTVEADGEAQLGTLGQELSPLADWGDIRSAAIDGAGRVWLSQRDPGLDDCIVFQPESPDTAIVFAEVSFIPDRLRRGQSGCWIRRGPGLELLTSSSNGTGGSTSVWRLDTEVRVTRYLHGGLEGTVSPGGAVAVSQYSYYPPGGNYLSLRVGRLSAYPQLPLRAAWRHARRHAKDRFPTWTSPAYSATGRLAVVRAPKRGGAQVLVGRPGAWHAVWKPGPAVSVNDLGWTSTGDLVVASTLRGRSDVRIFPDAEPGSSELLYPDRGANGFAIGPDAPPPAAPPPAEPPPDL